MYVIVKGAGMTEVNDIYKIQGESDNVSRYVSESGFELFRFLMPNSTSPINKRWYIGNPDTKQVFYICKSNDDLPPINNWKVHPSATVPAPILEIIYEDSDKQEIFEDTNQDTNQDTKENVDINNLDITKESTVNIKEEQKDVENNKEENTNVEIINEKNVKNNKEETNQISTNDNTIVVIDNNAIIIDEESKKNEISNQNNSSEGDTISSGSISPMCCPNDGISPLPLDNHTMSIGRRSSIDIADTDKIYNENKDEIMNREEDAKSDYIGKEKNGLRGIDGTLKVVIPSFERVDEEKDSYILYSMHIYRDYFENGHMNHEEWNIKRRYGRFKALLQILKIENPKLSLPALPKTSLYKNLEPQYLQEKRTQLEQFMSCIIDYRNQGVLYIPPSIEKDTLCIFLRGNCVFLEGIARNGDGSLRISLITNDNHIEYYTDDIRLNLQDYTCPDCGTQLYSNLFTKNYRLCEYTQMFFCNKCHTGQYSMIPAKILHYWDFMTYRVSNIAKEYLDAIYRQPLLCPVAVNPFLYDQQKTLQHLRLLRLQLNYMHDFILSCKQKKELLALMSPRLYLMSGTELYSMADLVKIYNGTLNAWLQHIVDVYADHITNTCETCKNKGFICEVCNKMPPIYAFQLDTVIICRRCNTVYHKECYTGIETCPRCIRNKKRRFEEYQETGHFPEEMQNHFGLSLTAQNEDFGEDSDEN